jgi:TP901 family phage tail tape measure protein
MSDLTGGVTLAPLLVDIQTDVAGFRRDMSEVSSVGVEQANNLSNNLSGQAKKIGTKLSDMGKSFTMGLTLPLVGAGVAALKVGNDFEAQMSRVKAISEATGTEFEKLNQQAIDLGASTAFSAMEAAQGMENLASAGFNTNEIMAAMPGMMDLAASSGEDLASSADIAASTLRGFGLEAEQAAHVADVLAKNSADTNAAVADTGEAMKYIAPVAHSMGLSLEEVTAAIGIMANAGIKGSQAGTTLRTSLSRLADPSKEAKKAMEQLGFVAFDSSGKLLPMKNIIDNLKTSTKDLTMQQKQQAISTIFGTEAMSGMLTLVDAGPEQLDTLTNSLKNSDGAAKAMATTMQNNTKSSIEQMRGSLETAGTKIAKSFAPTIIKITDKVGELADKFSNLSESQQDNIIKWGLMLAAVGPVLSIAGKGFTVFSKLSTVIRGVSAASKVATGISGVASAGGLAGMASGLGTVAIAAAPVVAGLAVVGAAIYAVSENNKYMNTSLSTTAEELPFLQRGFNALNGHTIKTRDEMEKLGLKYHEWSSDIAPDVVESIDDTAKAWQDLNFQVDNLKMNDIVITQETVDGLKAKTAEICDGIITEIKANQDESTKELSEYFNVDGAIDYYETTVLGFFDSNGQKQTAIVKEYQGKINEIYQKAADEHRGIAESEYIAIEEYEKKINQVKIDSLTKTSAEYQELQANFNVKMRNLDLEGASTLMQEKATKREEELASTREYYDTKIELLSMNLNNMNEPQRLAAEKELADLRAEKDKKVGIINDTYNEYLNTIKEKYPEIYDRIDYESGKILDSTQQKERQKVIGAITSMNQLADVTESGMQRVYNTETQTYNDVYVKVDETTGNIIGLWDKTAGEILGNNQEIRDELKKTSESYYNFTNYQKQCALDAINSNSNYSDSIKTTAAQVIGALQGTGTSVNGLYTEVVNCNGTPVRVQVNKDGTIANIDEIIGKVNSIPTVRYTTVLVDYKDASGGTFKGSQYYSDGRGGYIIPSYNYNGIDNVPYDGYTARLHEGERVLTKKENEQYSQNDRNTNNPSEIVINSNLFMDGEKVAANTDRINGNKINLERRKAGLC